jgi:hypothetical protein
MNALGVAILYFGAFLAIGWEAKRLLDRTMRQHGAGLDEVHEQAGTNRRPREMFLLGAWRKEPYP